MPLLLIIGAGIEQVPAYQRAHELGLEVLGTDINPKAPGFAHADYKIIASTRDPEGTAEQALKFHEHEKPIDGVITIANDVPLTVSTVAHRLGLPSSSLETARIASDKSEQYKKFTEFGVPIPETAEVSSWKEFEELTSQWGFPIIVKPPTNRGARGVLRITESMDLKAAFEQSVGHSDRQSILVQKFIDGPQISAETCVIDGKAPVIAYSYRNYEFLEKFSPYIIENGGSIPAQLSTEQMQALDQVIANVIKSYGLKNGPLKGDLVLTPEGKAVALEFANRLGGGFVASHSIPLTHGVKLLDMVIKLALGWQIHSDELVAKPGPILVQRFFWPKPGKIKEIRGFDRLDQFDWIVLKQLYVDTGEEISDVTDHSKRAGFITVRGPDLGSAKKRAHQALSEVEFIME